MALSIGLTSVPISLLAALTLAPGTTQFVLIGLGLTVITSFPGPSLAVAADVTPKANHASTFALLALVNMLVGAVPDPLISGWIADASSLLGALLLLLASRVAICVSATCHWPEPLLWSGANPADSF